MKSTYLIIVAALTIITLAEVVPQRFTINYGDLRAPNLMRSISSAESAKDSQATAYRSKSDDLRKQMEQEQKKMEEWEVVCKTAAYFDAEIYPLNPDDLHPQLAWAGPQLKAMFTDHPYPGDYNQAMHPDGLRMVRVDYAQLPVLIQNWITDHPEQKSICMVDGVAFFAPGVILEMIGLFAGEGEGDCKGQFPTDPEVYFSEEHGDVKFGAGFLGTSEMGDSLKIKAVAEKMVRKGPVKKADKVKDEL